MNSLHVVLLCGALALASPAAEAQMRVRGTIVALDGDVLTVKAREGRDLKIELTRNATVAYVKALTLGDIRPGTPLGTTAVRRPDGKLMAREVHVFPGDRVPNEGHRPIEAEPDSSMTNATVSAVVQATNGRELTLSYKGGSQILVVPDNTPVVIPVEADRSYLVPGEYVYIAANMGNDGRVTASRVQVSKDGVRPPQ